MQWRLEAGSTKAHRETEQIKCHYSNQGLMEKNLIVLSHSDTAKLESTSHDRTFTSWGIVLLKRLHAQLRNKQTEKLT